MKVNIKILVFAVVAFCSGTAYCQDDFVALTSAQLLKGLNDRAFLNSVLSGDGFTLIKNSKISTIKSGYYEYWQYKNQIFVDIIFTPAKERFVIVRVNKDYKELSERLIQTFPHKRNQEYEDNIEDINVTHINKETAYTLRYTHEGASVGVDIWFDDPFYYFQYTSLK